MRPVARIIGGIVLFALSVFLVTLAIGFHWAAASRQQAIDSRISIAIVVAIGLGWTAYSLDGRPVAELPSDGRTQALFLCLFSLRVFKDDIRQDGIAARILQALVAASMIAAIASPRFLSWVYPAIFFAKPAFRALHRRTLGEIVFEFPRLHGDRWNSAGMVILIVGSVLLVASIVGKDLPHSMLNLAIMILADSLRRNAGRSLVRVNGIESHSELFGWPDLRSYEWRNERGTDWLNLKTRAQDLWIETKPVSEVTAAFERAKA